MVPSPEIVHLGFLLFLLSILAVRQCLKDTESLHFPALPFSVSTSPFSGSMRAETMTFKENN